MLFLHDAAAQRWPLDNLLQLHDTPLRLGAQIGVSYGADYRTLMADAALASRVALNATRRSLWQMIARGRVDGLIADEHSARFELHGLGLSEQIRPTALGCPAMRRRSPSAGRACRTNSCRLRRLVEDGSYARIERRYLGP